MGANIQVSISTLKIAATCVAVMGDFMNISTFSRLNTFNETYWKSIVSKEMEAYQHKIVKSIIAGFDGSDTVEESKQWSFPGAFLYSLTVITTIGKSKFVAMSFNVLRANNLSLN